MSGINRSVLSQAEIENLQSRGITPKSESLPVKLNKHEFKIAKIVELLLGIHPANPLYNIPFLDVVAACRFYECEDIDRSIESACEVIKRINLTISENAESKRKKPSSKWMQ
jgi:hypothetical protein